MIVYEATKGKFLKEVFDDELVNNIVSFITARLVVYHLENGYKLYHIQYPHD